MIRSFQTRIVLFFSVLFVGVQLLTLLAVYGVTRANVIEQLGANLAYAEQIFDRLLRERGEIIASQTRVLAADFGFRAAVADSNPATVRSAVENLLHRIHARRGFYIDLNGVIVADTAGRAEGSPFSFQETLAQAEQQGQSVAFGLLDGELYEFAVVPVLAPVPIGWVALAVAVDRNLVQHFQQLSSTALEISLVERAADGSRILASSLPEALQTALREHVAQQGEGAMPAAAQPWLVELGEQRFITQGKRLPAARAEQPILAYLQVDLDGAFQPYRIMLYAALGLLGLGLAATLGGGVLIARRISRPVRLLNDATQRIMAGRYDRPIELEQQDELGHLAQTFNHMMVQIEQRESRLAQQLRHDALTGLPNRLFFEERLDALLQSGTPALVALVSLDRYTEINNTLGHELGDRLVVEVGALLHRAVPELAALARVASDEFALAVALPPDSEQWAETLLLAFDVPLAVDQFTIDVSAHIGIACCDAAENCAKTLLRNADVAMYVARLRGPRYGIYRKQDDPCKPAALSLMGELRSGLESGQFQLYVQPLVVLAERRISHVECLIRWRHPERGLVPPDDFIPLAEQTGHIHRVTVWVLKTAFQLCADWRRLGTDTKLALNLSAKDLFSPQLPLLLDELLASHPVSAADFMLEVTESSVMQDAEQALKMLQGIRAKGFLLAVDDFGTGYSSMAYLKKLPVSELKIDKSFVLDLANNAEDAVIVRSIIELGHSLGMSIVAEGLENPESFAQLQALGCDMAQGYWISRPMPAEDFAGWLEQSAWSGA